MDPNELFNITYIGDVRFKTIVDDKDTYYSKFLRYIKGEISRNDYFKINLDYLKDSTFKKNITTKCINYTLKWANTYNVIHNMAHNGKYTDYHMKYHYDKFNNDANLLVNTYIDYIDYLCKDINIKSYPVALTIINKTKVHIHEGLHRLLICLYKKIPVDYIIIDCKYELLNKINEVVYNDAVSMYKQNDELVLYNPIDSIFFSKYKVIRDDRRNIVKQKLDKLKVVSGLEIGPHNGAMSFYLHKNKYNMTAIEYDAKYYNLCLNLSELMDNKPLFIHTSIYDYNIVPQKFDFIVGLSIFYHLYRNNKTQCEKLMNDISKKTKYLFIDDEENTKIFTKDIIYKIYNQFNIEKIYTGNDNRSIYLIDFNKIIKNT